MHLVAVRKAARSVEISRITTMIRHVAVIVLPVGDFLRDDTLKTLDGRGADTRIDEAETKVRFVLSPLQSQPSG